MHQSHGYHCSTRSARGPARSHSTAASAEEAKRSRGDLTSDTVTPPAPEDEVNFINLDTTNFKTMSRAEQIRHFEVEGYLVLPDILSPELCERIKEEMSSAEMGHTDYSEAQMRSLHQPQWHSRTIAELIAHPPMIEVLTDLFGSDIVFTRGFYQKSLPGCLVRVRDQD